MQQLGRWNSINGNSGNSVSGAKRAFAATAPAWHVNAESHRTVGRSKAMLDRERKNILMVGLSCRELK